MLKKFRLFSLITISAFAVIFTGCGSGSKSTGGAAPAGTSYIGFIECFNCHSDSNNPAGKRKVFGDTASGTGWFDSRHANTNDSPGYPYSSSSCTRCHNEFEDSVLIEEFYSDTGNDIFGTENRGLVSCESCHGGGGNHYGVGPLGNDLEADGEFDICTKCHELDGTQHSTKPERLITDSHIDDPDTEEIEGYILNPDGLHSDQQGNMNSGTCTDCHDPHSVDNTINEQWAASGHAGHISDDWIVDESDAPAFASRNFATGSSSCHRCHTSTGFRNIANDPENYDSSENVFIATGDQREMIYCWACHANNIGGLRKIDFVTFPSELSATLGFASNICMQCHQGRESGLSVAADIAATPGGPHGFINRHYLAAGAILFGTQVQANFEYPSKTYMGQNTFSGHVTGPSIGKNTCAGCHLRGEEKDHNFSPILSDCNATGCHEGITDFDDIGLPAVSLPNIDYDGDSVGESFQGEIDGLLEDLLARIQTYASTTTPPWATGPTWILYSAHDYPYFFKDTNSNGVADSGEIAYSNGYNVFDDKLLAAAYNFHSDQDPCGHTHNYKYVIQTIIDSIEDLGGPVGGYIRP